MSDRKSGHLRGAPLRYHWGPMEPPDWNNDRSAELYQTRGWGEPYLRTANSTPLMTTCLKTSLELAESGATAALQLRQVPTLGIFAAYSADALPARRRRTFC